MFKNNIFNGIVVLCVVGYFIMYYYSVNVVGLGEEGIMWLFGTTKELTFDDHQYYRIITSIIAHGGVFHLLMNMIALSSIGSAVIYFTNEKFSVITFIIAGLVSSLVTSFSTTALTAGVSGAIYGLFGILIYFAYKQHRMGYSGMLRELGPVILINLVISFLPSVSMTGHLVGLACGLICSYIYDKKKSKSYYY